MLRKWFVIFVVCVLAACEGMNAPPVSKNMYLTRMEFSNIDGWDADNHVAAFYAFLQSCTDFNVRRDTDAVGKNQLLAPVTIWKDICRKTGTLTRINEASARSFFENEFIPMIASGDENDHAFFTGYYEPLLRGSRVQASPFVYPVYKLPPSGIHYTREQIDRGALAGHAQVIAYVDDPVQLFFMHIQGSGSIKISDTDIIHVGYAGRNGQPYVAIGKVLADRGLMDRQNMSMQAISQWLYDHPQNMWQIMWENPSYIFFQEMNGGPYGTENVPLTANRSLAVDKNYIPLGMPVFVNTIIPGTQEDPFTIYRTLMIAQDTGSAIVGPMRGDIFFGAGYAAEQVAGRMKAGGDFILLVPRAIASKMQTEDRGIFFHNPFSGVFQNTNSTPSADTSR